MKNRECILVAFHLTKRIKLKRWPELSAKNGFYFRNVSAEFLLGNIENNRKTMPIIEIWKCKSYFRTKEIQFVCGIWNNEKYALFYQKCQARLSCIGSKLLKVAADLQMSRSSKHDWLNSIDVDCPLAVPNKKKLQLSTKNAFFWSSNEKSSERNIAVGWHIEIMIEFNRHRQL